MALVALMLLLSCGSKEDQCMQTAQTYLKGMYTGDYQSARAVATGNVLKYIDSSSELLDGLNDEEKNRLLDYMGRAQYTIDPIDAAAATSDTVTLHYTLQFPSREATNQTMQLRKEGKKWVVFAAD